MTESPKTSTPSANNGESGGMLSLEALSSLPEEDRSALLRSAGEVLARKLWSEQAGLTFWNDAKGDYMRKIPQVAGYLDKIKPKDYRARYERGGIAERIIEAAPRATWAGEGPDIVEDPDPGVETPFEAAFRALAARINLWGYIERADILAGLGHYGVLVIGTPRPIGEPLERLAGPESVLYLTALAEDRAQVESEVDDSQNERFGLPAVYQVRLGSGLARRSSISSRTRKADWTRVIHVAEGMLEDEVCGKPRLRAAWNRLDDLEKILAGGAEATWRRADPGLHVNVPMFGPDGKPLEFKEGALKDQGEQIDEYIHNLRRVLKTRGTEINQLDSQVPAFGGNASALMEQISAITGIPQRILTGSERGELASTQDRSNWADRIQERRGKFATPLVRNFIDRLIEYGALPEPTEYEVVWPEIDELSPDEQAGVAGKLATANKAQVEAGLPPLLATNEIRDSILRRGPIEDIEGFEVAETGQTPTPPQDRLQAAKLRVAVRRGLIRRRNHTEYVRRSAAGEDEPEWRAVTRAADSNIAKVMALFIAFWAAVASSVDASSLTRALEQNNRMGAERVVRTALRATEEEWQPKVQGAISGVLADGAEAAVQVARRHGTWLRTAARSSDEGLRAATFSASFNAVDPRAVRWAATRSSSLIKEISPETMLGVRELITSGIAQGIPPVALSRQIREVVGLRSDQVTASYNLRSDLITAKPGSLVTRFPPAPTLRTQPGFRVRVPKGGLTEAQIDKHIRRYERMHLNLRAQMIARTETMRAANEGQRQAWLQARDNGQLPQNQKRMWVTAGDSAVRDSHAALEGEIVGLEESFSGGFEPGEEPRCRCGQGLPSEEDLARSADIGGESEFRNGVEGLLGKVVDDPEYAIVSNDAGDVLLRDMMRLRNFDAKPALRPKGYFDDIPIGETLVRGTQRSYYEQFTTGELRAGGGIHGNGTYFARSENLEESGKAASLYGDTVFRAQLSPTARTIDIEEVRTTLSERFIKEVVEPLREMAKSIESVSGFTRESFRFDQLANAAEREILEEPGKLATYYGYDAIVKNLAKFGGQEVIVLNRGALIAEILP